MKHLHLIYTLLFGVAVLLFFGLAYPHHLHYQEQFQLFLFDNSYVLDVLNRPGGLADLLGRFTTQFFLYAWVGAALIAVLLSTVQQLSWSLLRRLPLVHRIGWGSVLFALSFLPSSLLWLFLLDENALMSGPWALLLTLLVARGYQALPRRRYHWLLLLLIIPALYWLVGPVSVPIPADALWLDVHYHRYPSVFPVLLWGSAVVAFLVVVTGIVVRKETELGHSISSGSVILRTVPTLLLMVVVGLLVSHHANFKAERVMHYDFMARYQQWNRILQTIDAERPNNQIGVTVQNLALAMHGRLADHLFDYNQNGTAGLLPDVRTDATSPLPTAEAFYQLGMISVAQRTVFEAQEAILDYQKSARCYKRLAETNLILGHYAVARKYLMALQKTLFYRQWATQTLALLNNELAISRHPEYGRLRKMSYYDDFFFGGHVSAQMLENLFDVNPSNRLAYEYLVAYYKLTGDRESYVKFLRRLQ